MTVIPCAEGDVALITSTETRCVMDAATQGVEAAARNSVRLKAKWPLLN